jgi:hypothetical protein
MTRRFPATLKIIGIPIAAAAWMLAARLVWEQTVWSWARGPQMVGFSLMHSGLGAFLVLAMYGGLLWLAIFLIATAMTKCLGGKLGKSLLIAYALAWGVIATPYGFWQRMFIDKYSPTQAIDFFTYAAATGDLRTAKAFLNNGVDINSQGREGTALHGAAVEGEIEVMEFLIAHGANVNAINAYGDTPMANAIQASKHATESQALLTKYGGKYVRGSEEQRNRVIDEQVRKDIEEMDKGIPEK